MFARKALAERLEQMRNIEGYDLDNAYIDLLGQVRTKKERHSAHNLGLFQLLGTHIQSSSVFRRVLILRMVLGYEAEPEYHYAIALRHHFLHFGLVHDLPDIVSELTVPSVACWDATQILLDGLACWIHLILILTGHSDIVLRLANDIKHETTPSVHNHFLGLLGAWQLLSAPSSLPTMRQHGVLCWQIASRLTQHSVFAAQFCSWSSNLDLFSLALQPGIAGAPIEEQLHVCNIAKDLVASGALNDTTEIERTSPEDSEIQTAAVLCVIDALHGALVELARGGRVWKDPAICANGTASAEATLRRTACGSLLLAWDAVLESLGLVNEALRQRIYAHLAVSDVGFVLLGNVVEHTHGFELLRLAVAVAAKSVSTHNTALSCAHSAKGSDVVTALCKQYWPCLEMRSDLCCLLESVVFSEAEAGVVSELLLETLCDLDCWSALATRILLLCQRIARRHPKRLFAPISSLLLEHLATVSLHRKGSLRVVRAFFVSLAQLAEDAHEIHRGQPSVRINFCKVLCATFEKLICYLGSAEFSPEPLAEIDGFGPLTEDDGFGLLTEMAAWLDRLSTPPRVFFEDPQEARAGIPDFQLCFSPDLGSSFADLLRARKTSLQAPLGQVLVVVVRALRILGKSLPADTFLLEGVVHQLVDLPRGANNAQLALAMLLFSLQENAEARSLLQSAHHVGHICLATCDSMSSGLHHAQLFQHLMELHLLLLLEPVRDPYAALDTRLRIRLCNVFLAHYSTEFSSAPFLDLLHAWGLHTSCMREVLLQCAPWRALFSVLQESLGKREASARILVRKVLDIVDLLWDESRIPSAEPISDQGFSDVFECLFECILQLEPSTWQRIASWWQRKTVRKVLLQGGAVVHLVHCLDPSVVSVFGDDAEMVELRRLILAFLYENPRLPEPPFTS